MESLKERESPAHSRGGQWNLGTLKHGETFRCMSGNATYAKHQSGAIVRVDKDRRTPKERKAARRARREAQPELRG